MPDFDKLKHHTERLLDLLNDPHPGLFSWCVFVSEHWRSIADLWDDTSVCAIETEKESTPL